MPCGLHRQQQHHDAPDRARRDAAEPGERGGGHQWQHDQRRGGEDQRVAQFVGAQHFARECVQPRARGQQCGDRDGKPGGEAGLDRRGHSDQEGHEQREFGGHARIPRRGAEVGDHDQRAQQCPGQGDQPRHAQRLREGAGQCRHAEGANAGEAGLSLLCLAPFALDADQQPCGQGDGQPDPRCERIGLRHAAHRGRSNSKMSKPA